MEAGKTAYALVTPVRNESATIAKTIESVLNQTVKPVEWVIVDDGSSDSTVEIIKRTAADNPWIRLIEMPVRSGRSFARVAENTMFGIASLATRSADYIGLLDADVRFDCDYFERLIGEFSKNPKLGLAGGVVIDVGTPRTALPRNRQDVPGAVQFFRRTCLEAIGRIIAIPEGGWDALTCAAARMHGFETQLIPWLVVDHLKPRNVSEGGEFRRKWQMGIRDRALDYGIVFESLKCIGRLTTKPFVFGAFAWWLGYCHAALFGTVTQGRIPFELRLHLRMERSQRLYRAFHRLFRWRMRSAVCPTSSTNITGNL